LETVLPIPETPFKAYEVYPGVVRVLSALETKPGMLMLSKWPGVWSKTISSSTNFSDCLTDTYEPNPLDYYTETLDISPRELSKTTWLSFSGVSVRIIGRSVA
jgi:hypothetical protein